MASCCDWYICDEQSNFCFWSWLSKQHNQKPHTLQEVGELTNTSINNIELAQKFAVARIKKNLKQLIFSTDSKPFSGNYSCILEYIQLHCK